MEPKKDISKQIAHAELTHVSRCIHKGPCLITGFSVAAFGAAGTADLYDGESASGVHKCRASAIPNTTFSWPITHPIDFDKGIYVEVTVDTMYVTVCYIPESWKAFI